jgi:hypothetical protein
MTFFRCLYFSLALFVLSVPIALKAQVLTVDKVIASSLLHYPEVIKSMMQLEQALGQQQAFGGQFDSKLKVDGNQRLDGYYNGQLIEAKIEKPFQFLASSIYTGYRRSRGEFPLYEGKSETGSNGEYLFGVAFSLWKNRKIDQNRRDLWNAQFEVENSKLFLMMTKLNVRQMAQQVYWEWVALGKKLEVHKLLLGMALERQDALTERIKRGDLARIYSVENEQYIVKRRIQVNKSKADFFVATQWLSLFYRDKEAKPILVSEQSLPPKMNLFTETKTMSLKNDLNNAADLMR